MNHLIICPEYPPAPIPPGGIGTYVQHISSLLADAGETVHVIGTLFEGAPKKVEESHSGRLIIHRVSLDEPVIIPKDGVSAEIATREVRGLWQSDFPPQCFSWQASILAEKLVEEAGIDVIESQEFAAPLYYFQLRRALGLGPKRQPPCIVHLHSPSELIAIANEWDSGNPYFSDAKRLEEYSIKAADARLCPSNYLARQTEEHYGLESGCVKVIPLPIGDNPVLERTDQVWKNGTICYVGRLEARKGVIEWVDAAVQVANEYPSVEFEFIGANLPYLGGETVQGVINHKIPSRTKARFHFRGSRSRTELVQFLLQARAAVVPSRWENFPNTCIEAMCSGLPVIATQNGGMAEMIDDGQTGWLAQECNSTSLADALRRALDTPPHEIAIMGHKASERIRRLCDNAVTVERHIEFRSQIARQQASRSIRLPVSLACTGGPPTYRFAQPSSDNKSDNGIAIVVSCLEGGARLNDCLAAIRQQTRAPTAVVVVVDETRDDDMREKLHRVRAEGWEVCEQRNERIAAAKNAGIDAVLAVGRNPLAFVFIDTAEKLYPRFVEACASVLLHCPEVGLVSSWNQRIGIDNRFVANPCPTFPYQLLSNEIISATAIRTEAIRDAGFFRKEMYGGYEDWDLINAVMAAGWVVVTFPALLSERKVTSDMPSRFSVGAGHRLMRGKLLARFPELVERYAQELVLLLESRIPLAPAALSNAFAILRPRDILRLPLARQLKLARKALLRPHESSKFVLWHGKKAVERAKARVINLFRKKAL